MNTGVHTLLNMAAAVIGSAGLAEIGSVFEDITNVYREKPRDSEIAQAFRRAAELRDRPIKTAVFLGRKDGIRREVEVLHDTGEHPGYKHCLLSYNAIERDAIRFNGIKSIKTKTGMIHIPPQQVHDLWIREDRLRYL